MHISYLLVPFLLNKMAGLLMLKLTRYTQLLKLVELSLFCPVNIAK